MNENEYENESNDDEQSKQTMAALTFIMTSGVLLICPSSADNGTPFTLILVVSGLCLAGFLGFCV
jgi:hypothetical protein